MQRYFSDKLDNNHLVLKKDDLHHIKNVMRMRSGDLIEVVFNKEVYLCTFEANNMANIKSKIENNKNNNLEITLIVPLLQEQKMSLILQKATELGVSKIIPVIMSRSIIKFNNEKFLQKQIRWQRICKEASEQSKRNDIPIVTDLKKLTDLKLEGLNIVCSTQPDTTNITKCLKNNIKCDKINIVIGPEGGIAPDEEQKLVENGFKPVSLGKRILRVETVPMVILSMINYEYME